jgi:hypothetical protein
VIGICGHSLLIYYGLHEDMNSSDCISLHCLHNTFRYIRSDRLGQQVGFRLEFSDKVPLI